MLELASHEYLAVSNNSDADDEDYPESLAQGENISISNNVEIDEIQYLSTFHIPVKEKVVLTGDARCEVPEKTSIAFKSCVSPSMYHWVFKQMVLLT
ncbi:hypothetical protein TNCV_3800811 [Trichonephila clavipes]|nr:hypothetical protein TNCV_3800811 [Trichonephila clavipes]